MKFVKLTKVNGGSDSSIWVNPNHVVSVAANLSRDQEPSTCRFRTVSGGTFDVFGAADDVIERLCSGEQWVRRIQ